MEDFKMNKLSKKRKDIFLLELCRIISLSTIIIFIIQLSNGSTIALSIILILTNIVLYAVESTVIKTYEEEA